MKYNEGEATEETSCLGIASNLVSFADAASFSKSSTSFLSATGFESAPTIYLDLTTIYLEITTIYLEITTIYVDLNQNTRENHKRASHYKNMRIFKIICWLLVEFCLILVEYLFNTSLISVEYLLNNSWIFVE